MMKKIIQKALPLLLALLPVKYSEAQGIQKYTNSLFVEYGFMQYNNAGDEWLGENNDLLSFGLGYNKDVLSFLSVGFKVKHYNMAVLPGANTLSSNTAQLQVRIQRPRISRGFRLRRFTPYFETGIGQAIEYVNQNVEKRSAEYVYVPLVAGVDYNFSNHWALGVQGEYRLSGRDFDAVINDFENALNRFNAVSARLSFYFGRNRKRPTAPRIYTRPSRVRSMIVPKPESGNLKRTGFLPDPKVYSANVPEATTMQVPETTQAVTPAPVSTMKVADTVLVQIVNPAVQQDTAGRVQAPVKELAAAPAASIGDTDLLRTTLMPIKDTLPALMGDTTALVRTDSLVRDTMQLVKINTAPVLKQDTAALIRRAIPDTTGLIKDLTIPVLKQDRTTLISSDSDPEQKIDTIPLAKAATLLKGDTLLSVQKDTLAELKKNSATMIQKDTLAGSKQINTVVVKEAVRNELKRDTVVLVQRDTILKLERDTLVVRKTDTISTVKRDTVLLPFRDTTRLNGSAKPAGKNAVADPVIKTSVVQTYTPIPVLSDNSIPSAADNRADQLMEQKVNQLEIENAALQSRLQQSEARNALLPVSSPTPEIGRAHV